MTDTEFWLALSGMVATALTALIGHYYTHKARTTPFREQLYARQFDAIVRILGAYADLRDEMSVLFGPHAAISAHDAVWHRVREAANKVAGLAPEAVSVLPDPLLTAYTAMHDDALGILRRIAYDNLAPAELDNFVAHGTAFANTAREYLGTNALSAETRRSFSKSVPNRPVRTIPQRAPDSV